MDLKLQPNFKKVERSCAGSMKFSYRSASNVVTATLYLETRPAIAPAVTTCSRDP